MPYYDARPNWRQYPTIGIRFPAMGIELKRLLDFADTSWLPGWGVGAELTADLQYLWVVLPAALLLCLCRCLYKHIRNKGHEKGLLGSQISDPRPEGIEQINDSVFQLYGPPDGEPPEIEILFFHGLQATDSYADAFWKNWYSSKTKLWPRTLLGSVFPKARILSISYDSCVRKTNFGGRNDLYSIGEKLYHDIIGCSAANVGIQCPVILIGHSLGGIVIKEFLEYADKLLGLREDSKNVQRFINNLCGIFFYSTPHIGCKSADFAARLPGRGPVLECLRTLSKKVARLNQSFSQWRYKYKIPTFSTGEAYPTKLLEWSEWSYVIVPEASARQDTDGHYTIQANHFNVCKPDSPTAGSFVVLQQFIRTSVYKRLKINLTEQTF